MRAGNVTAIEGVPGTMDDGYAARHARLDGAGRFVKVLAEGGMGAVLLADFESGLTPRTGRLVVKVLRRELTGDARASDRFRRELLTARKLSSRLQTARVVPCVDAVAEGDPDRLFALFPYYPDGSLAGFMEKGCSVTDGLRILVDAVEGLQGLHGHGYLHRDFCPQNVLVSREAGQIRGLLGDLGVAVPFEKNTVFSDGDLQGEREIRVGHVGFTAPADQGTVAADLHGVGATLYWLLAGFAPSGSGSSCRLPPLAACRPGVSDRLHREASSVLAGLTQPGSGSAPSTASGARAAIAQLATLASEDKGRRWLRPTSLFLVQQARFRHFAAVAASVAIVVGLVWVGRGGWPLLRPAARTAEVAALPAFASPGPAAVKSAPRPVPDVPRALVLARKGPDGLAESESILSEALTDSPDRGELRLALARVLWARGQARQSADLLGKAPRETTHGREIAASKVMLDRLARQSR